MVHASTVSGVYFDHLNSEKGGFPLLSCFDLHFIC